MISPHKNRVTMVDPPLGDRFLYHLQKQLQQLLCESGSAPCLPASQKCSPFTCLSGNAPCLPDSQAMLPVHLSLREGSLLTSLLGNAPFLPASEGRLPVYQSLREGSRLTCLSGNAHCLPASQVMLPVYLPVRKWSMFTCLSGNALCLPASWVMLPFYLPLTKCSLWSLHSVFHYVFTMWYFYVMAFIMFLPCDLLFLCISYTCTVPFYLYFSFNVYMYLAGVINIAILIR